MASNRAAVSGRQWNLPLAVWLLLSLILLTGCTDRPWNSPYPDSAAGKPIFYSGFSQRPKHLDPARSYSENEYIFIAQIYEPPLQYHFLKRPYQLVPLAAAKMPQVRYFDAAGKPLPADADADKVAVSEYRIHIQPGIHYQPHAAFAKDKTGAYRYHDLTPAKLEGIHQPGDFAHTGTRELVAADYVYEIKRLANPRAHSPIAGLMAKHIQGFADYGKMLKQQYRTAEPGAQDWLDLRQYPLPGVKAVDRYTLQIRLKDKYPQFKYWLAMPFFAPMPWEAEYFYSQPGMQDKNITLDWFPVGTGPFMLTENNPNLRIVLSRNPRFHGERYPGHGEPDDQARGLLADAGKPLPFLNKAVYTLEKENIPYWNKFLQGYYDVSGVTSDSFDQAISFNSQGQAGLTEDMKAKGIQLETSVDVSIFYMGFNMQDAVVGGDSERARKLRRAISVAVDYEEFISIFRNGRGIPAQGPIPPSIPGHHEGKAGINPYVYHWVDGHPERKSVEAARRLMAEAGYPDGVNQQTGEPLILYFDTTGAGPDAKSMLNWMRKQFAKLGIQLVIRNTDYNRFQDKMLNGTAQIFQWGWNADYPDPENFLFLLFGPNGKVDHNGENAANYSNPEFDRLFERMKSMESSPQRQKIIDRMVAILRRDAPWVWGFHPKTFSLYHGWYHNVKPNLLANNTLKYTRLEPHRRSAKRLAWNPPVVWPVGVLLGLIVLAMAPAVAKFRRRERSRAL